jgi:predicted nucleic acid-binding protein
MTLLDTNVFIDLQDGASPFQPWARSVIENAVATSGAIINVITFAELVSGGGDPEKLARRLEELEIGFETIPAGAAAICGAAYLKYRAARRTSGGGSAPPTRLPDFFIGAHAEFLGSSLATRDPQRFTTYFPNVILIQP